MKKIKILLLLASTLWISSCIDDIGNYNYKTIEDILPISITKIENTEAIVGEVLEIEPTINNIDNESRYVYLWYASKSQTAGVAPKRDTLSLEKNLSVKIKIEAGEYNLVFEVRDPKLDIYTREQVKLIVRASNINSGWFVLKDMNDETDFDYIRKDGSEIIPDVLRNRGGIQEFKDGETVIGGQQLQGKAIKMIWQNTRYYHQVTDLNGVVSMLANQQAYHILTDKDFKTFNSQNLYLFKPFNQQFYEAPKASPQNIQFISSDTYLINDGKSHAIYGMSANIGKFSAPKTSLDSPNHNLHSDISGSFLGALVFDKTTRSFFNITSSGATMNKIASPPTNTDLPSLFNMNFDLVRWLEREGSSIKSSYCLMKEDNTNKYYIGYISGSLGGSSYPFTTFREVPSKAKFVNAQVMSTPQVASCIYFGVKNKLAYYLDATELEDNEKDIYTFPEGEEIAYIGNPVRETLIVLTNSSSGWKLYGFPIIGTTPDIEKKPSFTYSGQGNGRFVMYRN